MPARSRNCVRGTAGCPGRAARICSGGRTSSGWPAHSTSRSSRKSKFIFTCLPHQFVHDGAIVDAFYRRRAAVAIVEQAIALLCALRAISTVAHTEQPLGHQEIVPRLLLPGIDFQQHHIFRIVLGHDGAAQQRADTLPRQTVRAARSARDRCHTLRGSFGHQRLIGVERGEALNLDQLRLAGRHPVRNRPAQRADARLRWARGTRPEWRRANPAGTADSPAVAPPSRGHSAPFGPPAPPAENRRLAVAELRRLAAALLQQRQEARYFSGV